MPSATRPRLDLVVVGCAALAPALIWVPFYRDAMSQQQLSLWKLRTLGGRGFWMAVVALAFVVVAGLLTALANRFPGGGRTTRRSAVAAGAAAVLVLLAIGAAPILRARIGSSCFGYYASHTRPSDCTRIGVDQVPGVGFVIGMALTVLATTAALAALRDDSSPRQLSLADRTVAAVAGTAVLLVLAASFAPVFRQPPSIFSGSTVGATWSSAWHSPFAAIGVVLAVVGALLVLGGRRTEAPRAMARIVALLAATVIVAAAFARPLTDSGRNAYHRVDGVRVITDGTVIGWGFWILLAAAGLLIVATAATPTPGSS